MEYKGKNIIIWFFYIVFLYGCGSIDEGYEDFLNESDIIYPGKVDSIKVYPGRNRIKFDLLLSSDPNVKSLKVFWNGKLNSMDFPIEVNEIGSRKEIIIPEISEGDHTFYFYTYNSNQFESVPAEVFSKVYGDVFASQVTERYIKSSVRTGDDLVEVKFDSPNSSYAEVRTEISYKKKDGTKVKTIVPTLCNSVFLEDYKQGETYTSQTFIKPDSLSIDEFPTKEKIHFVDVYHDDKKKGWTIKEVSAQDKPNSAEKCIDGKIVDDGSSMWTARSGYPYTLILDMKGKVNIDGFYFVQRIKNYKAQLKDVNIYTTESDVYDDGWVLLTKGILSPKSGIQKIDLNKSTEMRYVKFEFLNNWIGTNDLSLLELGAFELWK